MRTKLKHQFLLSLTVCMAITQLAIGQNAMFMTNPQHTGFYRSNLPSNLLLTKKWKYKTNGMIFSSPVIASHTIYIGSDDSCLYALDILGNVKWKFESNGIIRSTPAVKDTLIYFNTYAGALYAVNTNTGREEWKYETGGEKHFSFVGLFGFTPSDMLMNDPWDFYTSSPVIVDNMIYFGSGDTFYALNNENGSVIWQYSTSDVIHSTPAVKNGKVFFGGWSGKLYALNAINGSEIWEYQTGTDATHLMQGIQASPLIVDTLVIVGARDAKVYALGINSGNMIWSTPFGNSWMPSSLAYNNGTIFTGSSEGVGLNAMDISTGKVRFSVSKGFYLTFSSPAITSETAIVGCLNGSVFAVDVNTGNIKSRFDTDGRISDPLDAILDNGRLNPLVFDPVSHEPYSEALEYVRRVLTAGSVASTPALANQTIYFGSSDSCVYAIYDDGRSRPDFKVSTKTIDLGEIPGEICDTSFYVKNTGNGTGNAVVYLSSNISTLNKSISFQPSELELQPGDSVKVNIRINPSELKSKKSYSANIITQSKANEYNSSSTAFTFITTYLPGISTNKKTNCVDVSPNPFNNSVTISYSIDQNCFVAIRIYDANGKLIKVLINQTHSVGNYKITWDAHDESNQKLRSGLYYCSIIKGGTIETRKIALLNQ